MNEEYTSESGKQEGWIFMLYGLKEIQKPKRFRLFALPYAGGSSYIYRQWEQSLPEEVDWCPVELPGRGRRMMEPLCRDIDSLVNDIYGQIKDQLDLPFAFYGYSMGSLLAYELSRLMHGKGKEPVALFVAACSAPHLPRSGENPADLPDGEFVERLRQFNGTPEEILQNEEMLQFFIPILRADFSIVYDYSCQWGVPLHCPIIAFGGTMDPDVPEASLTAWKKHTDASFQYHLYPGNHFFLNDYRESMLAVISRELEKLVQLKTDY
ncbi:thioesterase II family protein [Thermoactinomyces mirandus]|uniref:Thioesterase n=1 Tax=Thermoactinomyces mirandus TaxID=2756294 RepID=A0A7W2AQX6_9BACL|nr:thioesterase [Thermoactinomyces mirandus]MBA4600981.1 thioesterase [Thermoactinomyces mirandus]